MANDLTLKAMNSVHRHQSVPLRHLRTHFDDPSNPYVGLANVCLPGDWLIGLRERHAMSMGLFETAQFVKLASTPSTRFLTETSQRD